MGKQINEVRVESGGNAGGIVALGMVTVGVVGMVVVAVVVVFLGFLLVGLVLGLAALAIFSRQKRRSEEFAALARWQSLTPPAVFLNGEPVWHHQPSPAALRAIEQGLARQLRERNARPFIEEEPS